MVLHLRILGNQQACTLQLSWGKEKEFITALPYPDRVIECYRIWHQAYLDFYKNLTSPAEPIDPEPFDFGLRGRLEGSGSLPVTRDWRFNLAKAENRLLNAFQSWLQIQKPSQTEFEEQQPNCLDRIRAAIKDEVRNVQRVSQPSGEDRPIDLFLTCNLSELERLPWEALGSLTKEFDSPAIVRVARVPAEIRNSAQPIRRGRPRILVIWGDDTGLDFTAERRAVRSLAKRTEIQFVGWQPNQDVRALPLKIAEAIDDEQGWNMLLFAGHSNEDEELGGKLAIAPGISLSIEDIKPQLRRARDRGLQFTLFNSCEGLSLARSLIDLGFSQVVVMREPIHNRVAQVFVVEFLQSLAKHKDIHDSLLASSQELLNQQLSYPSAALVPSLFRHPKATLASIPPSGCLDRLKRWLPTLKQAIALAVVFLLSFNFSVQGRLIEQREWVQAVYRRATGQFSLQSPPILLVQVDNQSIVKAGEASQTKPFEINPIDRGYLAKLVDRLSQLNAQVIGIDYILDRQRDSNLLLTTAVKGAIERQPRGTWFVFANLQENGEAARLLTDIDAAQPSLPNWSMQGDINLRFHPLGDRKVYTYPQLLPLKPVLQSFKTTTLLPFAYLLALTQNLNSKPSNAPYPNLNSQTPLQVQLADYFYQTKEKPSLLLSDRARLHPITWLSYWFGQMWLHPVLDFSIPPSQIYSTIPAWKLLEESSDSALQKLSQQIVLIVAGGYAEAGLAPGKGDVSDLPAAVRHWRFWTANRTASLTAISGGEVQSYAIYQFLTQRLVVPIPDVWIVAIATVIGKAIVLARRSHSTQSGRWLKWLLVATLFYGLLSLQCYISNAVSLPWLLPSIAFWILVLPETLPKLLRKRR